MQFHIPVSETRARGGAYRDGRGFAETSDPLRSEHHSRNKAQNKGEQIHS